MRVLTVALTAVLILLSVAGIVGGFALLARRLLGMRFGLVRLLLAGLVGFAVAGPIAQALAGPMRGGGAVTPLWFLLLAGAAALVVAMVFLVVAEALVPSGSLPGPLELRRALRGRVARARRYSQISRIAVRHGLNPYLWGRRGRAELDTPAGRERLARSMRQALEEAGVTFVKLGQMLSTRPDLLPAELVDELGRLTDDVAPAAWDQVEQVLEAELGRPVSEVFADFDRRPLAAASVAQVHAARLRSGAEVAVKVQRPGIQATVERDLDIVARLARSLEARTRWALIGMRRSLAGNAPGGSGTVATFRAVGLGLAVATLLLGLVRFDDPQRSVDLLAALFLGWLIGWAMGPIAVRGAGQGLRAEWFALLPIPSPRLAAGLLAASFVGAAPAITLVAFAALPVAAARLGVLPLLVAVPAALLELVLVVVLSRVVVAALTATLSSRHGQELGGLLITVVIALASGGWSLAAVLAQQLAVGPGPALGAALRALPSGWGPAAVAAADRSDWPVVAAALAGLVLLCGLLLAAWAGLLPRTMRRPAGRAGGAAARGAVRPGTGAGLPAAWRPLPAGPTGAVVGKELYAWRRDSARTLLLLMALLISGLNLVVPALAFGAPALLPWVGLSTALIASTGAANVYGEDGTALWLTRMVPGVERADVRGRQAAWLLVVGPATVVLTVALIVLGGQGWAWPWVLAMLPVVLGATPGLMVWMSVASPVPEKDAHLRAGPFDTGDDPSTSGALAGHGWLMMLLVAATAVPGAALVLLGVTGQRPALQVAGVLVGVATGGLLYWWGGRVAARRLADRGAELMDLLRLGPQAPGERQPAGPSHEPGRRRREAAAGALWTLGVLCVFPQGLVPLAFNLFGVDPQVRVWFAARYLPQGLQLPVAAGFIVVGLAAIWWAETIRRRPAGRPEA